MPKLPDEGEGRLYAWCRFLDAEDEDELRGLAEGKAETQVTIARSLKAAGLPFDVIAQSTGLSLDEVAGL
jgi:predicted transposase/invertase (TIGR01784 family)